MGAVDVEGGGAWLVTIHIHRFLHANIHPSLRRLQMLVLFQQVFDFHEVFFVVDVDQLAAAQRIFLVV